MGIDAMTATSVIIRRLLTSVPKATAACRTTRTLTSTSACSPFKVDVFECDTKDLVATIRPLDDYSNTYIGLYVEDPTLGREILMVHWQRQVQVRRVPVRL